MAGDVALDPVTFEVLKNSFITSVDQMAEQILRTSMTRVGGHRVPFEGLRFIF